ncbi:hypothetical protein [Moorena producens]|uniref:hypothetical protein n=1 Tax=Moorena producens TaxID=1155739 RepID=UPI003C77F1A8
MGGTPKTALPPQDRAASLLLIDLVGGMGILPVTIFGRAILTLAVERKIRASPWVVRYGQQPNTGARC